MLQKFCTWPTDLNRSIIYAHSDDIGAKKVPSKFTEEETKYIIETYQANPCLETVEEIAEEVGKTKRSIISKLSAEGVYQKKEYRDKWGQKPTTRAEYTERIRKATALNEMQLMGLEKSSRIALKNLAERLDQLLDSEASFLISFTESED